MLGRIKDFALEHRTQFLILGAFLGIFLAYFLFQLLCAWNIGNPLNEKAIFFGQKFPFLLSNLTLMVLFLPNVFLLWVYRTHDTKALISSSESNIDLNHYYKSVELLNSNDQETPLFILVSENMRDHERNLISLQKHRVLFSQFPHSNITHGSMKKRAVGFKGLIDLWQGNERYRNNIDFILSQTILIDVTLVNIDFSGMDLTGSTFSGVGFKNCVFKGTNLSSSAFQYCVFSPETDFSGSNIEDAYFFGSSIQRAIFDDCTHLNSNFKETQLSGASFKNLSLPESVESQGINKEMLMKTSFEGAIISQSTLGDIDPKTINSDGAKIYQDK